MENEAEVEDGQLFRATTPDGRWTVECVYEPAEGGRYSATVVLDGKHVTESLVTQSQSRLLSWAKRQMKDVMRRSTAA